MSSDQVHLWRLVHAGVATGFLKAGFPDDPSHSSVVHFLLHDSNQLYTKDGAMRGLNRGNECGNKTNTVQNFSSGQAFFSGLWQWWLEASQVPLGWGKAGLVQSQFHALQ